MRRHRYPHGRSAGGIRVHNGIRIRIRKVKAVPVAKTQNLSVRYSTRACNLLVVIVNRPEARAALARLAREIIDLIAFPNGFYARFVRDSAVGSCVTDMPYIREIAATCARTSKPT